ncbi:hypothetical protein L873DRAFT_1856975 [Choiromyces venosus 120613-1]|uniref:PiggyBac transposable element-derived protein domain-containing protein n=1 Tax=Choiromyces venosus 120613-1 TaxID=1336337 RepID=A0A3N4K633_9PEZI|nr:hypothetical protein L873DRAFT_1856975 [Choiromyces venosus 120613-1]
MIFLGLIIYMGLYHTSTVPDYWRKDDLSQVLFEQLKRFFHVSTPVENLPRHLWYQKMEPLSSTMQCHFQCYCTPATEVSIDEMMI